MSAIDQINTYNTQLTKEQLQTAFSRALNDYTDTEIDQMLDAKVDAEEGMGLSQNSYTNGEKETLSNLNNDIYDSGERIEAMDDLNDYQTAGSFCAYSSLTLINSPTVSPFRMEIVKVVGGLYQKIFPLPFAGTIYIRSFDGTNWGSWYELTGVIAV